MSAERARQGTAGEGAEERDMLVAERPHGRFTRRLFLGENLDLDRVEASYERAVLTLAIPVAETARPRKVEIARAGAAPEAIEAGAPA